MVVAVPKGIIKSHTEKIVPAVQRFWESRHISVATAEAFGVLSTNTYFPQLEDTSLAVAFPYFLEHKNTGYKCRAILEKHHVCSEKVNTFFGTELLEVDAEQITITEGEADTLSLYEADIRNALSVPNGASFSKDDTDNPDGVFGYLWAAKEVLDKAKRVIIATDRDAKGQQLGEELARRIGRFKCWKVTFPLDCKDSNDVLIRHGKAGLQAIILAAQPWPVAGLYEASAFVENLWELYKDSAVQRIATGFSGIDPLFSPTPGLLTVVTGIPGSGKSTLIDQLLVNLSEQLGWAHVLCSFENSPPSMHMGKLLQVRLGKHFFEKTAEYGGERMTEKEVRENLPWVDSHFKFIHQSNGEMLPIETIIENMKVAVFRWGIKAAVIDPFNYVTRPKNMENETQWISDMLGQVRLFASAYGVHVFFVAHPTKLQRSMDGTYRPPTGYDISGSAAFYAKADFGVTVHRETDGNETQFIVWKRRFDWLGREGKATLLYDISRNKFHDGIIDSFQAPERQSYQRNSWN